MAKRPDDNLENFFLDRVKDYKIDYREQDWQKLREMLDASDAMKASAFKQKITWVGSGALLVISVSLLIWMSGNLTSQNSDNSDSQVKEEMVGSGENNSANSNDAVITEENKIIEESVESEPAKPGNELKSIEKVNPEKEISITKRSEDRNTEEDEIAPVVVMEEFPSDPANIKTGEKDQVKPERNLPTVISDSDNEVNDKKSIRSINIEYKNWDLITIKEDNISPSFITRNSIQEIGLRKSFAWNFSIASDYSSVGMSDFDGPKPRAGISLESFILQKLSFHAGINYSVKNYIAYGSEYTPPYGFWTKGVVPHKTYGKCNVLDIPVNLKYYMHNANGQAYVVSAGLSSWLMLKEFYTYKYESNDPDLIQNWQGSNENNHYFSIINLSAGFEHPLNNKYSILIEPYLNIPLGGVGYGNVDLYSTGLKFSMKIYSYKLSGITSN